MQSSDNVLFHFPKAILQHASPFFQDLFSISSHADNAGDRTNAQPLVMEEDSMTLDILLQWIHPAQIIPSINSTTIARFLGAAHKYQMEKIIEWFEREVTTGEGTTCAIKSHQSLLSTNPMLVLSLAERYCLPELARLALRRAIIEPTSSLLTNNAEISHTMWKHLLLLRKERTDWFMKRIDAMEQSHHKGRSKICWSCHSLVMSWAWRLNDVPSWQFVGDDTPKPSYGCNCVSPQRQTHRNEEKHYNGFGAPVISRSRSSSPIPSRSIILESDQLSVDAKAMELQLPELPKGLFEA